MTNWELEEMRVAYHADGDPKHPDWEDLAADRADMDRKRLKEEGPAVEQPAVSFTHSPEPIGPTKALNAALAQAQGEFPTIGREKTVTVETKTGGRYTFSYAELGTILKEIRPVLAKHGLAISQQLEHNGTGPALRTELRHKDGGIISTSFPLTRIPESPQQLGSLLTYLRRYKITALLGIATEDDDDAGQATEQPSSQFQPPVAKDATEPQRKKIYALKSKLSKAGYFTDQAFDEGLEKRYGTIKINELTRENARDLIDRLEGLEAGPAPEPT